MPALLPLTEIAISPLAHEGTRIRIFACVAAAALTVAFTPVSSGNRVLTVSASGWPFCCHWIVDGS